MYLLFKTDLNIQHEKGTTSHPALYNVNTPVVSRSVQVVGLQLRLVLKLVHIKY